MDSIVKQYPINSFIIWESTEKINCNNNWGDYTFPDNNQNTTKYLLDGQQRYKSLLGVYKGVVINRMDFKLFHLDLDKMDIFFNKELNDEELSEVSLFKYSNKETNSLVPLYKILSHPKDIENILSEKSKNTVSNKIRINEIKLYFDDYKVPISRTVGDDIMVAPDIFKRLNSTGTPLNKADMLIAKMYRQGNSFNFRDSLLDYAKDMNSLFNVTDLNKVKEIDLITTICMSILDSVFKEDMYKLEFDILKSEFENIHLASIEAIPFLFETFNITSRTMLPFNKCFDYATYLFYKTNMSPTDSQKENLTRLLIEIGLNDMDNRNNYDKTLKRIKNIIEKGDNITIDIPSVDEIVFGCRLKNRNTKINTVIMRTVDCVARMNNPKSLNKFQAISIDEKHIQKHHIFSTSVFQDSSYNLLNFMYLEDTVNNSINNKLPKEYFKELFRDIYEGDSFKFNSVLDSHFISSDFESNGINKSDVDVFIRQRALNMIDFIKTI